MFIPKITEKNVNQFLADIELAEDNKLYKFSIKNYFIEKRIKEYFDKMIIETLLTNDKMIDFFDKNEFTVNPEQDTIYKKDLINEDSFYGTMKNNKQLQNYLSKEFQTAFLEVLDNSDINFDIEKYMIVTVLIEEKQGNRIYTTKYQYYRSIIVDLFKDRFNKKLKKYKKYAIICGIILTLTTSGLLYLSFKS